MDLTLNISVLFLKRRKLRIFLSINLNTFGKKEFLTMKVIQAGTIRILSSAIPNSSANIWFFALFLLLLELLFITAKTLLKHFLLTIKFEGLWQEFPI